MSFSSRPATRWRRRQTAAVVAALSLLGSAGIASPAPKSGAASPSPLVARAGAETSLYVDSDDVTVITPTLSGSVEDPLAGWSIGGRYLVDVVTAASADIVATASPRWSEIRHAFSGSVAYKRGDIGGGLQASASIEPDYRSLALGGTATWELYQKNITLLFGYSYMSDTAGRSGTPFDVFERTLGRHTVSFGTTLVLSRATLATAVVDAIVERGDPSKPYRYVPLFHQGASADVPAGASPELVNAVRAHERPAEQLPLARERFALTGRLAHRFSASTFRLEERLYIDTWGLMASTSEARYIADITRRLSLAPRVRVHVQSGVDFWQRAYELVEGAAGRLVPPDIRTGDRELGPLRSFTGGVGAQCDVSASAGARSWVLGLQLDGILTGYSDALYITRRSALFTALTLDATFE
jgi:hypothetical protein